MHVLAIGAHPDDIEGHIGGTVALFRKRGDAVKFVSVTDGSKGHYAPEYIADPDLLVRRRHAEITAAVGLIGAEYECMGIPDGEVYVNPANTEAMVRLIRTYGAPGQGPDLVLLNRPTDYHRDHRYSAQLVLDATYMLTVPPMCPDTRHLDRMPVFAYWHDDFTEGGVFRADVAVPIDNTIEAKIDMACKHESQFFEWLPYNAGVLENFPKDAAGRRAKLSDQYKERAAAQREKYSAQLADLAGGTAVQYVEAFQISEYGRRPGPTELANLFPISPAQK
jgi:LmbE family N-acetylglucosaminyl deacetylase